MPSLSKLRLRQDASSTSTVADATAAAHPGTSSSRSMAFVSKSRRVRFELTLRILDLNNVPLVSGTSFIKWHLPSSTAAEHRGSTGKCTIRDHRVAYEYEKKVAVRLTVGKDGMLQECSINFEILQEYGAGGRGERIRLGDVKLNLAEYVEANEMQSPMSPGASMVEEEVVRRYLMQESKINSTLKVGITMRHVEGTRDYYAPPLKTAPVFGGIAGIIHSGEANANTVRGAGSGAEPANVGEGAADGSDPVVPILSSHNKEIGEMQDMYRRTLAAFWASGPNEMRADESIEDIFSGGDGWGKNGKPGANDSKDNGQDANGDGFGSQSSRPGSGATTPNAQDVESLKMTPVSPSRGMMGGRNHHHHHHRKPSKAKTHKNDQGRAEVDEFDVRDDLVSWRVGEKAHA